jgi:hypothetical protein
MNSTRKKNGTTHEYSCSCRVSVLMSPSHCQGLSVCFLLKNLTVIYHLWIILFHLPCCTKSVGIKKYVYITVTCYRYVCYYSIFIFRPWASEGKGKVPVPAELYLPKNLICESDGLSMPTRWWWFVITVSLIHVTLTWILWMSSCQLEDTFYLQNVYLSFVSWKMRSINICINGYFLYMMVFLQIFFSDI